jgi:hypothetical protein
MISLINFGDSPFYILFWLVAGIFGAVIVTNLLALVIRFFVDRKTAKLLSKESKGLKL